MNPSASTHPHDDSGCPRCGQAAGPGDRFCAACGQALPAREPDRTLGDQRITVVHAELRGTPELTAVLGPEELTRVLDAFHQDVARIVTTQLGFVNQRLGESAVALFGLGGDAAEGARHAVEAALALQSAVRRLGDASGTRRGVALHVRTGIDTGDVHTGPGDGVGGVLSVSGDVLMTAARLRARAGDDEVWVGPNALSFIAEAFEVEATEPLPGRSGQGGSAHRIVARRPTAGAHDATVRPGLVGRDWERATLLDALRAAVSAAQPACVLIEGPRGAGKSRVVESFAREAPAALASTTAVRGVAVWFGRAEPPPAGQVAFGAFRDVLRRTFGADPAPEAFVEALGGGPVAEAHAGVLAELAGPWRRPPTRPAASEDVGEPRAAAIRDALAALIAATAQRDRPLLLCVDDWHWADRGSRGVLRQAVEAAEGAPLLVVWTNRPGGSAVPEVEAFAGLEPQRIFLEPLGEAALAELLGGVDAADAARTLAERSHGSPLLATELVRWAVDRAPRQVPGASLAAQVEAAISGRLVPANAEGLARARLESLDDETRDVLFTASALGARFRRALLERIWGRSSHLDRALDRLIARGWLHPDPAIDGYAFDHELLREVAHEQLDPAWRLELHQRVATALGPQGIPARIAFHAEEAGRPEQAADAAAHAGDAALAAGDGELARTWYGRALERLEVLPETVERRRAWVQVALRWVATHPVAHERRQLAVVRECQARAMDRGLIAEAVEALRLEGSLELARGRVDEALACLERCLRLVGWNDADARARLYVWLGRAWAAATEFERAQAFLEDAIALRTEALGAAAEEDATTLEARLELGSIRLDVGDLPEARRVLALARERSVAARRRTLEARAWARTAMMHVAACELPEARIAADHVRDLGERAADPVLRRTGEALGAAADALAEGPPAAGRLTNALDNLGPGNPLRSPSFDDAFFALALAAAGEVRASIKRANAALGGAARRDLIGESLGHRALGVSLAGAHDDRSPTSAFSSLHRSAEIADARGQLLEVAWSRFRLAEHARRDADRGSPAVHAALLALRELGARTPAGFELAREASGVRSKLAERAHERDDAAGVG